MRPRGPGATWSEYETTPEAPAPAPSTSPSTCEVLTPQGATLVCFAMAARTTLVTSESKH